MGYYTEVTTDSPVEFWKMDEASGTTVASAGSGNHSGSANNTTIVTGKHVNARSFNGTNASVSVGSVADFTAQTNYTVEAWFKISSTDTSGTDWRTIWRRDGAGAYLVRVGGSASGIQQGAVQAYLNGRTISTGSTRFDDDAWHHVVVTKASTTTKLFVDNVEYTTASGTLGGAIGTSQSLYIGSNNGATGEFFKGSLDSIAIYHTALNTTRIGVHYSTAEGTNGGYTAEPMFGAAAAVNAIGGGNAQTLDVTADTYVSGDVPNENNGSSTSLSVGGFNYGTRYAYFAVATPRALAPTESIKSAKLRVYVNNVQGTASSLRLARVTSAWTEATTYNTRPSIATEIQSTKNISGAAGTWVEFDVSQIVNDWLGGATNYGIALRYTDGNTLIGFSSSEGANPPQLVVEYSLPAAASLDADEMTASALLPDATTSTSSDVSVGTTPLTATAHMGEAAGGAEGHAEHDAEPMDAYADTPGGQYALTVDVAAQALEATAEAVDPTWGTTLGAIIEPRPLEAVARWKQPALVNDEPIRLNEADDRYFQRVFAKAPKMWLRLDDKTATAVDRMGGAGALHVGVDVGNYDAPDGRHSVYFDGNSMIEQIEPGGSNTDETFSVGTGAAASTLEFSFRTNKANTFLWGGRDATAGIAGTSEHAAREMYLRDGKIAFRTHYLTNSLGQSSDPYEFTGFKNLADGEWHHIIVRSTDNQGSSGDAGGVEIYVDGKLEVRRYRGGVVVGFPDYIGSRPASIDGINIGALPSSLNFVGDMSEVVFYSGWLDLDQIPRHYYDFMAWTPIEPAPIEAFAFTPAGHAGKGNQKRALYLWWDEEIDAYAIGGDGFNNKMNFDPVVAAHGNWGTYDLEGYKVFSRGVTLAPGYTPYRDEVTDRQSIINLETDLNIDDYDVIMFGDWPDEGPEIDNLEHYYPGERERLINQLRWANNRGVGLMVTHPRLAVDLGIVDRIELVPTDREYATNRSQGAALGLYDYGSAVKFPWNIMGDSGLEAGTGSGSGYNGQPMITDPAFLRNKAFFYGDTNKNDKFRVRALIDGLTNIPSYMIQDAIYQRDYDQWGWSIRAYKYLHRLEGLQIGDEFLIHGSDFGTTLSEQSGDFDPVRAGRWNGYYATPLANVKAGTVVTTFGATQYKGTEQVDNPYKGYATTIVLRPGDTLAGQPVGGKIFVNFTEQANMFINAAPVQDLPDSNEDFPYTYSPDTPAQREWEWSDTRNTLVQSGRKPEATGVQVTMPDGSKMTVSIIDREATQDRLQMVRSAQLFPVIYYPRWDMVRRGMWWLQQKVETNPGDVTVAAEPMTAEVVNPAPAVVAQRDVAVRSTAMVALGRMPKVAEDTSGDVDFNTLPATAAATFTGFSRVISAQPMTATAELVEDFEMVHASGEQVVLTLHGVSLVTLYLKEEV